MTTFVIFIMMCSLGALALPLPAIPTADCPNVPEFVDWCRQFNRNYRSTAEKTHRCRVLIDNLNDINQRQPQLTYTVGLNAYSDETRADFLTHRAGFKGRASLYPPAPPNHTSACPSLEDWAALELPESVDWRTVGRVTPVKDQQQCGSCWAFSTTGSVEGEIARCTGKLVSLSEQDLVDCTVGMGECSGCSGGLFDCAMNYTDTTGLETEAAYPYTGQDGQCANNKTQSHHHIKNWTRIDSGDEACLKYHVARQGPVSVAMDASEFQSYTGGVYNSTTCSKVSLDHAILVVGYGKTPDGLAYWIIKNSWGTSWGQKGYMFAARGVGLCGIDTMATRPIAC